MFNEDKNVINIIQVSRKRLNDYNDIDELVNFFPRKYIDFTNPKGAYRNYANQEICMSLHFNGYKEGKTKNKTTYFTGNCIDNITNRKVTVMWFGQAYMRPVLYNMAGHNIHVCGTLIYNEQYHSFSLQNPKITSECKEDALTILPVYSGISEQELEHLRKMLRISLDTYNFNEWIPEAIRKECNLMTLTEAYEQIHFPTSIKKLKRALTTLDFEKILKFAIGLEKNNKMNSSQTNIIAKDFGIVKKIASSLPYELTNDQKNTVNSILLKLKSGKSETALIQGDVGSGKTIVAILLMAVMAKSGYQSVLIAPTSVLAKQHFDDIKTLLSKFEISVDYLDSSLKAKEKKEVLQKVNNGETQILVGTHSVIGKDIEYYNLGLMVTDEEHKFGVEQRERLKNKSNNEIHSISMSATPIPRTLASVLFGESIDIYTIKEKPKGRLPVITTIENDYNKAFDFIVKELEKGHQCYIVCPKIEKSDKSNVLSVKELVNKLDGYLTFHNYKYNVAGLSGKMKNSEKETILNDFSNNKIQILVSTTVIEVGVNVPNSTVIAISNAERFGLASLHQLRGRVGRNSLQSYCLLLSDRSDNQRLNALTQTNDGFEIAKYDLEQRGVGDLNGVIQSGFTEEVAIMLNNPKMFDYAKRFAKNNSFNY